MRFGVPEYDRLISGMKAKSVLIYGEAGSGRTRLALMACVNEAMAGGIALYACKGIPVIDESQMPPEAADRIFICSFLSPSEVSNIIEAVKPKLTVVDPVNAWLEGQIMGSEARALNIALYDISTAAQASGSEIIFVGDVSSSADGIRPRHFRQVLRYCEAAIELRRKS